MDVFGAVRKYGAGMAYEESRVRGSGLVLWRSTAGTPDGTAVVPDGVLDLMWFRDKFVVAGADTRMHRFHSEPKTVTWGLRLPPGMAHTLFEVPINALTDERVELADLTMVAPVWLDTCEVSPWAALLRSYADLTRRADPYPRVLQRASMVDRAARRGLSVRETADLLGTTDRTLRRFSHQVFGYGMKTLSSIHRFQRARTRASQGASWADAAATAGYSDQAHLTRECRRWTGRTPTELQRSV
jgi:AraC-like DNA-binding protein